MCCSLFVDTGGGYGWGRRRGAMCCLLFGGTGRVWVGRQIVKGPGVMKSYLVGFGETRCGNGAGLGGGALMSDC